MRIFVIGGTRFIGPHVIRKLAVEGHELMLLHRGQTASEVPAGVKEILSDRHQLPQLRSQIEEFAPEVVLDMICHTERDATELVAAFKGIAKRSVVVTSMDVYRAYGLLIGIESGEPVTSPFNEDSRLRTTLYPYRVLAKAPDDPSHDYEKILVERVAGSEPDLPTTILRLPAVYGPGDHRCFDYLKRMMDGRSVILLGKTVAAWLWTRGYVENVADAIGLAVSDEAAAGRVYNVGEPDAQSEAGWVRAIGEAANWNGRVEIIPDDTVPDHLRLPYDFRNQLWGDTTRIRKELGYTEGVPPTEAIKRTVEWERDHPPEFDPSRFDYAAEDEVLKGD